MHSAVPSACRIDAAGRPKTFKHLRSEVLPFRNCEVTSSIPSIGGARPKIDLRLQKLISAFQLEQEDERERGR